MFKMPDSRETVLATWLLLQEVPGVGPARLKAMFDQAGSLRGMLEYILNHSSSTPGWRKGLKDALINGDLYKYLAIIDLTFKNNGQICTLEDEIYPRNLKTSKSAPAVLFFTGSLRGISERSLALVGTVTPTEMGLKRAELLAYYCAQDNIQVVSGLARGIDTASHKAALKYKGITFAVIAGGIDHCYPPENRELFHQISQKGAVISQFYTGLKPDRWMFPTRNETMCTLSAGTVIVEAHEKCGSLIQARHCFKHNRKVFLLQANLPNNEWASSLVSEGAVVVEKFEVIRQNMTDPSCFPTPIGVVRQNNIEKKKAFLFDLDGVLHDSNSLMENVYIGVIAALEGRTATKSEIYSIKAKLGNAPPYVLKSLGIDPAKGNELYKQLYMRRLESGIAFYPGIDRVLKTLRGRGYSLGIVTSQPLSRYIVIIKQASFKSMIDISITWNDIPRGQQKPHPAGILKAMQSLNVGPEDVAYVGDDVKDIEAARGARAHSIAALWGASNPDSLLRSNPEYVAQTPETLLEIRL